MSIVIIIWAKYYQMRMITTLSPRSNLTTLVRFGTMFPVDFLRFSSTFLAESTANCGVGGSTPFFPLSFISEANEKILMATKIEHQYSL